MSPVDYFEVFGIRPSLAIDLSALQKRFYELSRQWHPDRFAARSPEERQQALDNTAALNDAFRVLRDPVSRAEYLLAHNGLAIAGQGGKDVPPDLLEEALELNMALEEADSSDLGRFQKQYGEMLETIDRDLGALFADYDATPGEAILLNVRQLLNRRKYISNLTAKIGKAFEAGLAH
ncbi:MAG: Fe-S protein assembly co-chaperone HscB [Bryobacteraceae bacterium]